MDIDIQVKKIIQAYDGKDGWMINPLAQITEPKVLTAVEWFGLVNAWELFTLRIHSWGN